MLDFLKEGGDPGGVVVLWQICDSLKDCDSILDIGCGPNSIIRKFQFKYSVGLEGYAPSAEMAQKNKTHHEIKKGDIKELDKIFASETFDACIALDVIEHLPKEMGYWLIQQMKNIAKKKVIIFTPNGFLPQKNQKHDELQEHLSGWDTKEMQALGFEVKGLLGPKYLRGEYHCIKYKPRWFFALISLLIQKVWTFSHPQTAAAIFCVYTKKEQISH